MNDRLLRLLLRLYPRRIRERYGAELIDLHRELDQDDSPGRIRIVTDIVAGAFAARSRGERARLIAGCGAACAVVALGIATFNWPAAHPARPQLALTAVAINARSCFVGTGSECSLEGCQQFISGASASDAVLDLAPIVVARPSSTTKPRCAAFPRTHRERPVFADGSPASPVPVPRPGSGSSRAIGRESPGVSSSRMRAGP